MCQDHLTALTSWPSCCAVTTALLSSADTSIDAIHSNRCRLLALLPARCNKCETQFNRYNAERHQLRFGRLQIHDGDNWIQRTLHPPQSPVQAAHELSAAISETEKCPLRNGRARSLYEQWKQSFPVASLYVCYLMHQTANGCSAITCQRTHVARVQELCRELSALHPWSRQIQLWCAALAPRQSALDKVLAASEQREMFLNV